MGTSLTAAIDWQQCLAPRLSARWRRPVRIVSVSESGMTSRWGLGQVGRVVELSPSFVLIEFAINDANLRRFVTLRESRDNHRALLRRLGLALPETAVFLLVTNPVHGIRGAIRPRLATYQDQYRALAISERVELIDTTAAWRALPRQGRHDLIPDGVHPTAAAWVDVALPVIEAALLAHPTSDVLRRTDG